MHPLSATQSAARLLGALVLVLVAVVVQRALARPSWLVVGRPCDPLIAVDGLLTCADAAPRRLADLCPGARVDLPIRSGDALRRDLVCRIPASHRGGVGWRRLPPQDLADLTIPIHLNEASVDELDALPGVGPVLAARIAAARPFEELDALDRVKGIGPRKLAALRARVRLSW